jgi:uncharacterized membrane protein HdeD (DUF308 family)
VTAEVGYAPVAGAEDAEVRDDLRAVGTAWWIFLVMGIVWIFVSLLVLQFDQTSVNTITAIVGIVVLLASAQELFHTIVLPGWRWLHAILALVFLVAGIGAFVYSEWTFGALALLLSWFLLIGGTFEVIASLMNRDVDLWWLGLLAGIAMILIAFWAVGYPGRSGYLLVLWVGLAALFRGIGQIVMAFQVKKLAREVS